MKMKANEEKRMRRGEKRKWYLYEEIWNLMAMSWLKKYEETESSNGPMKKLYLCESYEEKYLKKISVT